MHNAQKFEKLLDAYWHPDRSQWTGQQIDEATDGLVTRSRTMPNTGGPLAWPWVPCCSWARSWWRAVAS